MNFPARAPLAGWHESSSSSGMPIIGLLVLLAAVVYFMTPEERARAFAAFAAAPRQLPRAARVCRLVHDDPFYVALRERAQVPVVTCILLFANVAVFAAMGFGAKGATLNDTLIAWGGNYGPLTTSGERWRLFSAVFLHAGTLHLLVTVVALAQLGSIVERLVGRLTFAVVYLAAGVMGSVIALAQAPMDVSVGPAAAVFSAYGMLLAAALRGALQSGALPVPLRAYKTIVPGAAIFAVYCMATGTSATIVKVGLCGGLVGGIVLTRVVLDRRTRAIRFAALSAATAVIVLMAAMAVRVVIDIRPDIANVIAIEQRTAGIYADAVKRFRSGRTTSSGLIDVIEHSIVPALQQAGERVGALQNVQAADEHLVVEARQYLVLRQQSWRLRAEALRKANMRTLRAAERTEQASLQVFDKVKDAFVAQ